jgi:hypothetical protein
MNLRPTHSQSKQFLTLLLGLCLGLAIFISPYQLHANPGSIFFAEKSATSTDHSAHAQHQQDSKELRCLRCVLYGFQAPETIASFVVILIVLGFITLAKHTQPFSFITLSKLARAPPAPL